MGAMLLGAVLTRPLAAAEEAARAPLTSPPPKQHAPPKDDGTEKNLSNVLLTAEVNVKAAEKSAAHEETTLPPGVLDGLGRVKTHLGEARNAWREHGGKEATDSPPIPAADLATQMERAAAALRYSKGMVETPDNLEKVRASIRLALEELDAARKLVPTPTSIGGYGDAQVSGPGVMVTPAPEGQAITDKSGATASPDAMRRDDGEGVKQPAADRRELAFDVGATTLSLGALIVVIVVTKRTKQVGSRNVKLEDDLARAKTQQTSLQNELSKLQMQFAELRALVQTSLRRTSDQQERDMAEIERSDRVDETSSSKESTEFPPGQNLRLESGADELPAMSMRMAPKRRDPVAEYNEARTKKALARAAAFAELYPQPMLMACINPAARNSGPFTELRFKEHDSGFFLAVEADKQMLVFPALTYDYTTGRKTLEGVFGYPEGEPGTLTLLRAAVVVKRGEEWALTEQGEFQGG